MSKKASQVSIQAIFSAASMENHLSIPIRSTYAIVLQQYRFQTVQKYAFATMTALFSGAVAKLTKQNFLQTIMIADAICSSTFMMGLTSNDCFGKHQNPRKIFVNRTCIFPLCIIHPRHPPKMHLCQQHDLCEAQKYVLFDYGLSPC